MLPIIEINFQLCQFRFPVLNDYFSFKNIHKKILLFIFEDHSNIYNKFHGIINIIKTIFLIN